MVNEIRLFLLALWKYWWGFCSCGAITVLVTAYQRRAKRDVPTPWLVAVMAVGLLVSCFLAWQNLYRQTQTQHAQIDTLRLDKMTQAGHAEEWKGKADERQDRISYLEGELSRKESPSGERLRHGGGEDSGPPDAFPPVLRKVAVTSQGPTDPTKQDAPCSTRVVVAATAEIKPTWLALKCDKPVMYASAYMNQGGMGCTLINPVFRRSKDRKTIWFSFTSPSFSPETPLVFTLSGRAKIVARSVAEERPPADAEIIGGALLQLSM